MSTHTDSRIGRRGRGRRPADRLDHPAGGGRGRAAHAGMGACRHLDGRAVRGLPRRRLGALRQRGLAHALPLRLARAPRRLGALARADAVAALGRRPRRAPPHGVPHRHRGLVRRAGVVVGARGRGDRPGPPAPPRWKQASVIWIAFFPTSLALSYLLSPLSGGLAGRGLRVLVTTLLATPWMTYVLLPFVTRLFGRWLKAG